MTDSFDSFREGLKAKQEEMAKAPAFSKAWAAKFIKKNVGRWVTFRHPKHGTVAAKCIDMKYSGLTDRGAIPDFQCTMLGRSTKARNEMAVSLVEDQVRFWDSKEEAIKEAKT